MNGASACPLDPENDVRNDMRMCLAELAIDFNVSVVAIGLIADYPVGAQQTAEARAKRAR